MATRALQEFLILGQKVFFDHLFLQLEIEICLQEEVQKDFMKNIQDELSNNINNML